MKRLIYFLIIYFALISTVAAANSTNQTWTSCMSDAALAGAQSRTADQEQLLKESIIQAQKVDHNIEETLTSQCALADFYEKQNNLQVSSAIYEEIAVKATQLKPKSAILADIIPALENAEKIYIRLQQIKEATALANRIANLKLHYQSYQDNKPQVNYGSYMAEMQRQIKKHWLPPQGNETKRVTVRFKIDLDGKTSLVRIFRSSGVEKIDLAALNAIATASPLAPLPTGADTAVIVEFTFDYNIMMSQAGGTAMEEKLKGLLARAEKEGASDAEMDLITERLGSLYYSQKKFADAEPLFLRSLSLREKMYGFYNIEVAKALTALARTYEAQNKFIQAEPLLDRARVMVEKVSGPESAESVDYIGRLAALYKNEAKFTQAELLYKRALAIAEKTLPIDSTQHLQALNGLADLLLKENKLSEAEPLCKQALELCEKIYGKDSSKIIPSLNSLAALYWEEDRYIDSELLIKRAMKLAIKNNGPDSIDEVSCLINFAKLRMKQKRFADAQLPLEHALAISQKIFGQDSMPLIVMYQLVAAVYLKEGKYFESEQSFRLALDIIGKTFGPDSPAALAVSKDYLFLLNTQNRTNEAKQLQAKILEIESKAKSQTVGRY